MFSHTMIGANDINTAKSFYDAEVGALGVEPGVIDPKGRCFYRTDTGVFAITQPIDGNPAGHGYSSTIGFVAANPTAANAWHAAELANGGSTCEDPPGPRGDLYLAYLRDPSGKKICALHRFR